MIRLFFAILLAASSFASQPLPEAAPESQGFSAERLKRLHSYMEADARDGKHSGTITLIARNGKIVDWQAHGFRDIEKKLPMERDTICQIFSMTKTVTSVAAMMLFEEGRFALNDPVSNYLPEFKSMKVFVGGTAAEPQLEPATSPITIKQLFTHTSGLSYGFGKGPVDQLYGESKGFAQASLKDFINLLAKLPLAAPPGKAYNYSVSIDVLSRLVEVIAGQPFDKFVEERIFRPLQMNDTFYVVPESKRNRVAAMYSTDEGGKLRRNPGLGDLKFATGGHGLSSTTADYARFAQMLLNSGELDGRRILSRKTVELMMQNHLNVLPQTTTSPTNGEGFGLGGAVRIDLAKDNTLGSVGQFGWSGAASTYYRIDPKEKIVAVLFSQHLPNDGRLANVFSNLVYQALVD